MCEQDLELTPPILPDRANFCGRGHPKIDLFHTNILFFIKIFVFLFPFQCRSICKCLEIIYYCQIICEN